MKTAVSAALVRLALPAVALVALSTGCTKKIQVVPATSGAMSSQDAAATVTRSILTKNTEGMAYRISDVRIRHGSIDVVHSQSTGGRVIGRIPLDGQITAFTCDVGCFLFLRVSWIEEVPWKKAGKFTDLHRGETFHLRFRKPEDAMPFVHAFNELVARRSHDPGDKDFEAKAAAWRAASPKPALSEAGNRSRVLAENAARENDPDAALQHFTAALETDPTWPAGNLNAALLLANTGDYGSAVRYLKRFLLLEPDGRDSAAARDKLIIWEDKASRATP